MPMKHDFDMRYVCNNCNKTAVELKEKNMVECTPVEINKSGLEAAKRCLVEYISACSLDIPIEGACNIAEDVIKAYITNSKP